jgi:hypothetical protein
VPRTLTAEQAHARQVKAIDRKYARIRAQVARENARRVLAARIGNGITQMALRHSTSMHRTMAAFVAADKTYCGKSEQHWDRVATRQ